MAQVQRLLEWFASGRLVRPSAEELNFVDLVRALAGLAGTQGIDPTPGAEHIRRLIGPAEHFVFVLVDGLSSDMLSRLPAEGFLRAHLVAQLQSVFPSTTATALTTLATGLWPCQHGVGGWWTYLEKFNLTATTLRFEERFTERPLERFGVRTEDLFGAPSMWARLKHKPLTVAPAHITHTTFSQYAAGHTAAVGYQEIPEALELVRRRVAEAGGPTFTYLYLPQLDSLCHKKGTGGLAACRLLLALDEQLAALAEALARRARLVISADHGLADTPQELRFVLTDDEPLLEQLHCPPTGEPTVPYFHVRPGCQEAFRDAFAARLGQVFALITPQEAEDLALYGPGPISPVLRRRLGDFIGVCDTAAAVYYQPPGQDPHVHVGVHAGLRPEQMIVPLILG